MLKIGLIGLGDMGKLYARKLSGAAVPCTLVSEPGAGYSLKWS